MRKAQTSMEFMMTYGWALLIVLATIGALSYVGVYRFTSAKPDMCLIEAPFTCKDVSGDNFGLKFSIENLK